MINQEFHCPVSKPYIITQTYKEHLDYAKKHPEIKYNGGIDLYSDDHHIFAAFDGIVDMVSFQAEGYGNYIRIKHDFGYSIYAHMCTGIEAITGTKIKAGEQIGWMGNSGFSTGIHLHFEIRDLTGKVLDPSEFFTPDIPINACSPLTAISAPAGGNLRKTPLGELITTIPFGTKGKILDGPVYHFGLPIYQVEFPIVGWMAAHDIDNTEILDLKIEE